MENEFTVKNSVELNNLLSKEQSEKLTDVEITKKKNLLNKYELYIFEKSNNEYKREILNDWY